MRTTCRRTRRGVRGVVDGNGSPYHPDSAEAMNAQAASKWLLVLYAAISLPGPAVADLLAGKVVATMSFHGSAPDTTLTVGPTNSLVGPGVELEGFGWTGFLNIDFSDTSILITANAPQPFGYLEILRFSDVKGTIPDFTGVTVSAATNWAGFDPSKISRLSANVIDINLTGLQGQQGQQILLHLTAAPGGDSSVDNVLLGQVSLDHHWQTVTLGGAPPLPVVILGPPTYYGSNPGVVRLRSVSNSGFEARFQEWDFRSRDLGDNAHTLEKVPYVMLEQGRHVMNDGSIWEVSTFLAGGTGAWHPIAFQEPFQATPYLFLTAQTTDGGQAISLRARNVTADGFEVALLEEEALMDGHAPEVIGYLAIFNPGGDGWLKLDGPSGPETPYHLHSIAADHTFTPALGALIKVEEEQSLDAEIGHVRERVDVLTVGNQVLAQQVSSNGGDTTALRRCVEACP